MTGEITLTGQVLPVGGIKEKLVAARRSEIETVILPARNREHVEEIDPELLDGLEFVFVDSIDEVLEAALMDEPVDENEPAAGAASAPEVSEPAAEEPAPAEAD